MSVCLLPCFLHNDRELYCWSRKPSIKCLFYRLPWLWYLFTSTEKYFKTGLVASALTHGALSMAPNRYYLFSSLHRSLCGRHSACLMFCLALFAMSLAPITLLETAGAQYVPAQVMCGTDEFIPAA